MKYTNYFAMMIKTNGVPALDADRFKTMMNVVFLEGKIEGIKYKAKKSTHHIKPDKDIDVFDYERKLIELTNNMTPEAFLNHLVILSGSDY